VEEAVEHRSCATLPRRAARNRGPYDVARATAMRQYRALTAGARLAQRGRIRGARVTLTRKLQVAVSLAVLVTAAVVAGYAVRSIRTQAAADAARLRAEKTAQVKAELADKVNTVYALVDAQVREAADERYLAQRYGQRLGAILDVAGAALRAEIDRARRGAVPLARAQAEALATLRAMRFDGGKGYLWINGVGQPYPRMLMHPILPELEGKVLDDPAFASVGEAGRNVFQVAVEVATRDGEGFIRYSWPEPDGSVLLPRMPKFSHVRLVPEWGWVVGTGVYVDEVLREKVAEIASGIGKIRYGSEYFWISTAEAPVPRMVMHPFRPELDGQRLDRAEFELDVNGRRQNLFAAFRDVAAPAGEGYAEYAWPKPADAGAPGAPAPKISFVKLYPPLGWIIGTGRYVDDIEAAIARQTAAADAQVSALVRRIVLAALAVVVVAVAGVSVLAASLTRPLAQLVRLTRDVAEDDKHLSRRIGLRSRDEIGQLAAGFDHMAERVEASFRRVREQREVLESVLSNVPHCIYWKDARGVYLGCNEPFARAFGLASADAIAGRDDGRLAWTDPQRELAAARDREVVARGEPALDVAEVLRDAGGRDVSCLASRVPLRDHAGAVVGVLGVFVRLGPAAAA
jgi:methyl-accepting chemotaxis protein